MLFRDFFRQQVPKYNGVPILYYKQAMELNERMLFAYCLISTMLLTFASRRLYWFPCLLLAALLAKFFWGKQLHPRINLLLHLLIIYAWCIWYVITFGWSCGAQHLLLIALVLVFFSLYETPLIKLAYFFLTLLVMMILFRFGDTDTPKISLDHFSLFLAQLLNTVAVFLILAGGCVVYSSNLQETERQLLLHNEQLQQEAETDPLTKLFNRRCLLGKMNAYLREQPSAQYCVAIADIDFFKRVNDTYGHNCGDYVLRRLSELFLEYAKDHYWVGRWGGEEFCFFFPGLNLDEAGSYLTEVCLAVRKMPLEYEGNTFSITLTAGIEEYDFNQPLEALIENADRKLYMGKQRGRDQIVI